MEKKSDAENTMWAKMGSSMALLIQDYPQYFKNNNVSINYGICQKV